MNRANLAKRLLFAAWAVPVGWLVINYSHSIIPSAITAHIFSDPNTVIYPGHLATILLVFLGASEYIHMLSLWYPRNGFWLVYIWLGLQMASYFEPYLSVIGPRLDTFILFMLVAVEAFVWGKKSGRWRRASLLFSGTAFLSVSGYSMLSMYNAPFQTIFPSRFDNNFLAQMGIITVIAAIFMCDTAAYFIGSLFGKHHFSSISPRKTIEGSLAGLIAATVITSIGWVYLADPAARQKFPALWGVILGILIGVFAQVGDLVVSLMKRYFRVKDSSSLIPGHGGILDRFDSVFFALPVVQVFASVISKFFR